MSKIRVYPTGRAAEAWRVERDGVHLGDVRLTIDANGTGRYYRLRPDGGFIDDGSFTFDVWDRAAVVHVLRGLVAPGAAVDELDIEIKRPTR